MYRKMENTIVDKVIEFWFADASNSPENAFSRKPFWYDGSKIIDQEIKKIIDGQYERAKAILKKHEDKLHKLANKLLETEVIFKEDLEIIFGKRPFEKEVVKKEEKAKKTEDDTNTSSKKSA